jgi:predicted secreted protein
MEFSIDKSYIKLVSKDFTHSKLGASGTEKFIFQGLKEGETIITMAYKRPWENSYLYQIIYKIQIKQ